MRRLEFILRAKKLGLRLDEIREIMHLHDLGHVPCPCTRELIRKKREDIDGRMRILADLRERLLRLEQEPRKRARGDDICPIIEGGDFS